MVEMFVICKTYAPVKGKEIEPGGSITTSCLVYNKFLTNP